MTPSPTTVLAGLRHPAAVGLMTSLASKGSAHTQVFLSPGSAPVDTASTIFHSYIKWQENFNTSEDTFWKSVLKGSDNGVIQYGVMGFSTLSIA